MPADPSLLQGPKKVRVLTLNIFLRPPLVRNNSSDHKEIRLSEFEQFLPDYDIIALQEIFTLGNSRQRRLINTAARHGFYFYTRSRPPPLFSTKFIDGGLLILSRYPIVETDARIYRAGNQIDKYAAKQCLYAKILLTKGSDDSSRSGDKHCHIFTTHMQASYYENTPQINALNDKARMDQVKEMMEFVAEKAGRDGKENVLVTGDFNVNARGIDKDGNLVEGPEYKELMEISHNLFGKHNVTDLVAEAYNGEHPPTYGVYDTDEEGRNVPRETVLTNTIDWCIAESIDYLIWVHKKQEEKENHVFPAETKIVEFFLPKNKIVTQVSDHYGVSTILHVPA